MTPPGRGPRSNAPRYLAGGVPGVPGLHQLRIIAFDFFFLCRFQSFWVASCSSSLSCSCPALLLLQAKKAENQALMSASCQWLVVLQVTPHHLQPHPHTHPSTPTSRPLLPPLPAAFISLSRLPGRRDLAHCRQTFLPFAVFKSGHCVSLQVLKDRSPSLVLLLFLSSCLTAPILIQ